MKSPALSFKGTGKKMLKSLVLTLTGAFTAWLSTQFVSLDFGTFTPFVAVCVPFVVNAINLWIKDQKK